MSGNSGITRSIGFCVRLCDGQYFRIRQLVNGTAENTCSAICPYSKTKLFFGSEIQSANAKDGQRYTTLESAFLYRKKQVAKCTCNGRDAFGLVPLSVKNDLPYDWAILSPRRKDSWHSVANLAKRMRLLRQWIRRRCPRCEGHLFVDIPFSRGEYF